MGITWMVGEQSWPLSMVVRPRDFITASATGVVRRPNGDRIGYEVVQSIDLPQCPPLPAPMVRGRLMYGAIYCQRENGPVDVYIQMFLESASAIRDEEAAVVHREQERQATGASIGIGPHRHEHRVKTLRELSTEEKRGVSPCQRPSQRRQDVRTLCHTIMLELQSEEKS
ncbi:hypothetical protein PF010_g25151 [Phytophthora fragariae]|nr:hypothetical protein PF010_g25151 [Phytophthora fragariae]KAE9181558.1 hypothetical protein PF004_g24509 [Phytophthora fragariae]KAE9184456.1 hypothetical protein PF002_g26429 [Phytophthora fragariae]KAE9294605.1 hypothetical protein PF008_g24506 [Phytophthora fragariae]